MKRKYKIAFDVSCLASEHLTGVGNVALNFYKALSTSDQIEMIPYLKFSRFKKKKLVELHLGHPPKLWMPWFDLFPPGIDLFHGPDFKIPSSQKFKKLVTVHDLVEFDGEYNSSEFIIEAQSNFKSMLFNSVPDHIHTVSEFTKSRLGHHFPDFSKKITRVYPGIDHLNSNNSVTQIRAMPKKYFLYVGTLEVRKNLVRIISAFDQFSKKDPTSDYSLVLVGRFGFGKEEIQSHLKQLQNPLILHLSDVSNNELPIIYSKATAFVFPSLYEGFGLPILEAMSKGIPVITSQFGAMNEVSGDAAIKVDPSSISNLAEAFSKIANDLKLQSELKIKGLEQAQKFTWDKSAAELQQLYLKLINS